MYLNVAEPEALHQLARFAHIVMSRTPPDSFLHPFVYLSPVILTSRQMTHVRLDVTHYDLT
jgi:hypothetical protein